MPLHTGTIDVEIRTRRVNNRIIWEYTTNQMVWVTFAERDLNDNRPVEIPNGMRPINTIHTTVVDRAAPPPALVREEPPNPPNPWIEPGWTTIDWNRPTRVDFADPIPPTITKQHTSRARKRIIFFNNNLLVLDGILKDLEKINSQMDGKDIFCSTDVRSITNCINKVEAAIADFKNCLSDEERIIASK